jgi:prepilin-type N-terminal cleavage/methylation domain-containing protein
MTTCKQPKRQENLTPQPPHQGSGSPRGKGGQDRSVDQSVIPVPSLFRGGLGRGYLYLLQKSITTKSSGFTIIECLLAIILVGILMTAVAPVIVLSVATRLQARRVEQASLAARTYIDGIQTGTIPAPKLRRKLDLTDQNNDAREVFAGIPAPPQQQLTCLRAVTYPAYPYCRNDGISSLYCVDNGGDCVSGNTKDFIVQAFRSAVDQDLTKDDGSKGYLLGVRVYRADAFDGTSVLTTTKRRADDKLPTKIATNTGGRGQRNAPMVELTTEVRPNVPQPNSTPSAQGSAMNRLCERLGNCPVYNDPTR